jgi:hypothetical protein
MCVVFFGITAIAFVIRRFILAYEVIVYLFRIGFCGKMVLPPLAQSDDG